MRSVRHPYILKCLDGIELDSGYYLVTEKISPLVDAKVISTLIWGVSQLFKAVDFINRDLNITHGLICPSSVFVTDGGGWRVGLFDTAIPNRSIDAVQDATRQHPLNTIWPPNFDAVPPRTPSTFADQYGIAGVICWCVMSDADRALVNSTNPIPISSVSDTFTMELKKLVERLTNPTVEMSLAQEVIMNPLFSEDPTVEVLHFLETLPLQTDEVQFSFFTHTLPPRLHALPSHVRLKVLLPELVNALAFPSPGPRVIIPSFLRCAYDLNAGDFDKILLPELIKLFKINDRGVRFSLLSNFDSIADILTPTAAQTLQIPILKGFLDSEPSIKDFTLRVVPTLVKIRSPPITKPDLGVVRVDPDVDTIIRTAAANVNDANPQIRANTIVTLAKIAEFVPAADAMKLLGTPLAHALKCPSGANRAISIDILGACVALGKFSISDVALKVLPTLIPKLLDESPLVRDAANRQIASLLSLVSKSAYDAAVDSQVPVHTAAATQSPFTPPPEGHITTPEVRFAAFTGERELASDALNCLRNLCFMDSTTYSQSPVPSTPTPSSAAANFSRPVSSANPPVSVGVHQTTPPLAITTSKILPATHTQAAPGASVAKPKATGTTTSLGSMTLKKSAAVTKTSIFDEEGDDETKRKKSLMKLDSSKSSTFSKNNEIKKVEDIGTSSADFGSLIAELTADGNSNDAAFEALDLNDEDIFGASFDKKPSNSSSAEKFPASSVSQINNLQPGQQQDLPVARPSNGAGGELIFAQAAETVEFAFSCPPHEADFAAWDVSSPPASNDRALLSNNKIQSVEEDTTFILQESSSHNLSGLPADESNIDHTFSLSNSVDVMESVSSANVRTAPVSPPVAPPTPPPPSMPPHYKTLLLKSKASETTDGKKNSTVDIFGAEAVGVKAGTNAKNNVVKDVNWDDWDF